MVITLGAQGVAALVIANFITAPGHAVNAVDTTGAGDCFCGYLASCLAQGTSIDDGLAIANAAAALAVQRHGASVAMPERSEVALLLPKRGASLPLQHPHPPHPFGA